MGNLPWLYTNTEQIMPKYGSEKTRILAKILSL